jgi:hypothetical protein
MLAVVVTALGCSSIASRLVFQFLLHKHLTAIGLRSGTRLTITAPVT